jgi:hypothetical protein
VAVGTQLCDALSQLVPSAQDIVMSVLAPQEHSAAASVGVIRTKAVARRAARRMGLSFRLSGPVGLLSCEMVARTDHKTMKNPPSA